MTKSKTSGITYLLCPHPRVDLCHAEILRDLCIERPHATGIVHSQVSLRCVSVTSRQRGPRTHHRPNVCHRAVLIAVGVARQGERWLSFRLMPALLFLLVQHDVNGSTFSSSGSNATFIWNRLVQSSFCKVFNDDFLGYISWEVFNVFA